MDCMGKVVSHSLALLCSLVLALPPCWCCAAGLGDCCDRTPKPSTPTDAPPHSGCCCCPQESPSDAEAPAQPPTPTKPAKETCCDHQPVDRPAAKPQPPEAPAPAVLLVVPLALPALAVDAGPAPESVVLPFALHVLHCVWLC